MFSIAHLPCKVVEGHDRPSDIQRCIHGIRHKVDQVVLSLRHRARDARSVICGSLNLCMSDHSARKRFKVRTVVPEETTHLTGCRHGCSWRSSGGAG